MLARSSTIHGVVVRYADRDSGIDSILQNILRRSGELKTDYPVRLNKSFYCCGNLYSTRVLSTMFIDGLYPAIKTLLARYREQQPNVTYLESVQFVRADGDALRPRNREKRKGTGSSANVFMEDQAGSSTLSLGMNKAPKLD